MTNHMNMMREHMMGPMMYGGVQGYGMGGPNSMMMAGNSKMMMDGGQQWSNSKNDNCR